MRGYDSHFIMQEIGEIAKKHIYKEKEKQMDIKEEKQMDINVIPNNMEKIGQNLTFIDSFQFMSQSLSSLVNNLPTEAFKYISQQTRNSSL